jgi:transposase
VSLLTPPKKQRRHYSGKKKRHTQKAQVIADRQTGQIIATAFAKGKTHDFALFRQSKTKLDAARLCLADSGYQGLDKMFAQAQTPKKKSKKKSKKHPLTDQERADNRALSSQRIRCEHIIGRLKVFKILAERYRHRRKRFGLRFNLIAAVCNLQIANLQRTG